MSATSGTKKRKRGAAGESSIAKSPPVSPPEKKNKRRTCRTDHHVEKEHVLTSTTITPSNDTTDLPILETNSREENTGLTSYLNGCHAMASSSSSDDMKNTLGCVTTIAKNTKMTKNHTHQDARGNIILNTVQKRINNYNNYNNNVETEPSSSKRVGTHILKGSSNLSHGHDGKEKIVPMALPPQEVTPFVPMNLERRWGDEKEEHDQNIFKKRNRGVIMEEKEKPSRIFGDEKNHDDSIQSENIFKSASCEFDVRRWMYRSFCILIVSSLIFGGLSTYLVHVDSSSVTITYLQDELNRLQEEVQHLHIRNEAMKKVLNATEYELQSSKDGVLSCTSRLEMSKVEREGLANTVTLLQQRLESIVGADDTLQSSLHAAWTYIEELKKEKMDVATLLENTTLQLKREKDAKEALQVEQHDCSERIVELELDSVLHQDKIDEMNALVERWKQEKDDAQTRLDQQQDAVALLQHQLDEENGHSWFCDMKIQYLENVQTELEGLINDSRYENSQLQREIQWLRQDIADQGKEAVAALNAVAKSATHRKAEQVAALESTTEKLIEGVKLEAANAINFVVSTMFRKNDKSENN